MTEREAGKYGMRSFDRDAVPLRLGAYFDATVLPRVPAAFGHFANQPRDWWGMLGNARYGDCVLAGFAHEEMVVHTAVGKPKPSFSETTVVQQYLQLGNGKDEGLDPVRAAQWRCRVGLADDAGFKHRVKAFALIDSLSELEMAVYLLGVAGVGFFMPNGAEKTFEQRQPWTDTKPPPNERAGHYMPVLGRNSAGLWVLSTWSDVQAASEAWIARYMIGGLAYLNAVDYTRVTGLSPEGLNAAQLEADFRAIPAMPHTRGTP